MGGVIFNVSLFALVSLWRFQKCFSNLRVHLLDSGVVLIFYPVFYFDRELLLHLFNFIMSFLFLFLYLLVLSFLQEFFLFSQDFVYVLHGNLTVVWNLQKWSQHLVFLFEGIQKVVSLLLGLKLLIHCQFYYILESGNLLFEFNVALCKLISFQGNLL